MLKILFVLGMTLVFSYFSFGFLDGKWLFKDFFISVFSKTNNKYNEALSNKNKVKKLNDRLEKLNI